MRRRGGDGESGDASQPRDRGLRRLARTSALLALGLSLFVLESAILPLGLFLPVPGAKLGLANLATLAALQMDGVGAAAAVSLLRVLLASAFGGTFGAVAFWLSLGGAAASLLGMALVRLLPEASTIGLSVAGAVCHNLGQLAVLGFFIPRAATLYVLPWLILLAIPAGLLTGLIGRQVVNRFGTPPARAVRMKREGGA